MDSSNDKNSNILKSIAQEYKAKFKDTKIDLNIENLKTHQSYLISTGAQNKFDKYTIVYGECSSEFTDTGKEVYFCENIEDIQIILDYMYKNRNIFINGPSEDVLDCCDIISLDNLSDDELGRALDNIDIY